MSDDTPEMQRLAAALMEQFDDDRFDRPQEYWEARAMRQVPMTDADDAALALSHLNRTRFDLAVAMAQALFVAEAANVNRPVAVAAASTGQRDVIRFDDARLADFDLVLRPSGTTDWLVFCTVKRDGFPIDNILEIRDVNGRVWLSGLPDEDGELRGLLSDLEDARAVAKAGLVIYVGGVALSTAE